MTLRLIPLFACVGHSTPHGDWTYHLLLPDGWLKP